MKYVFLLFTFLFAISVYAQNKPNVKRSWAPPNYDSLYKGHLYIPFKVSTMDGKVITNESCKGKVTFISFWFEGCAGCRTEFGALNELYDSLKNDTSCQFLAITYDDIESLKGFVTKYDLHYPVVTNGDIDNFTKIKYGMACPSIVLLDKDNRISMIGMKTLSRTPTEAFGSFTIQEAITAIKRLE